MLKAICFLFLLSTITYFKANAQMDPANQSLLSSPSSGESQTGLKSSRYQIKKGPQKTEEEFQITLKKRSSQEPELPPKKVQGAEAPSTDSPSTTQVPSSEKISKTLFAEEDRRIMQDKEIPESKEVPSVVDQVVDLVTGTDPQDVKAYIEQVHPDDLRMNKVELEVGSGVLTNHSDSNYSFRDYKSSSPNLYLGAQVWLTPFLGPYGQVSSSLGADVKGDVSTNSRISVKHENTEVGIDLRSFFGISRKAPSVEYGIHFLDYKMAVPGDSTDRVKLHSSGIGFHLSARLPSTPHYSWIFGGKLVPRLNHSEKDTGISLRSGTGVESSRVEVNVGGEIKMSRKNQIIWGVSGAYEKQQFTGAASDADPATSQIPVGVSVNNSFILFSFGYRWGQ